MQIFVGGEEVAEMIGYEAKETLIDAFGKAAKIKTEEGFMKGFSRNIEELRWRIILSSSSYTLPDIVNWC